MYPEVVTRSAEDQHRVPGRQPHPGDDEHKRWPVVVAMIPHPRVPKRDRQQEGEDGQLEGDEPDDPTYLEEAVDERVLFAKPGHLDAVDRRRRISHPVGEHCARPQREKLPGSIAMERYTPARGDPRQIGTRAGQARQLAYAGDEQAGLGCGLLPVDDGGVPIASEVDLAIPVPMSDDDRVGPIEVAKLRVDRLGRWIGDDGRIDVGQVEGIWIDRKLEAVDAPIDQVLVEGGRPVADDGDAGSVGRCLVSHVGLAVGRDRKTRWPEPVCKPFCRYLCKLRSTWFPPMPADEPSDGEDADTGDGYALEGYLSGSADQSAEDEEDDSDDDSPDDDGFISATDRVVGTESTDSTDQEAPSDSDFDDIVADIEGDTPTRAGEPVAGTEDTDPTEEPEAPTTGPDIDVGDPEVAESVFDFAALDALPASDEPASTDTESMFSDLVDRLGGKSATDEAESLESRSVGRVARLEAEGVLAPSTTTLVLSDTGSTEETETCASIMTALPAEDTNILLVWFSRASTDRFGHLLDGWEFRPAHLGVISRSESLASADDGLSWEDDALSMETINDPSDLTKIGIAISQLIADWEDSPGQTVVCFDSISELLRHNGTDRVFRFLHILEGRLGGVDATAHFHLDSRDHDLQTIRTLQSVFDSTIEVNEEGITRLD